ncbi:hypothetical protein [uncultured Thalassolituus sp.]|uniref:hypothetical protein n=1 Tax=uncultured Thalassolituus sp. TaxID=285273 RepID=UPI00263525CA|nr:hypothetical protein [uncultured Thalassolituus sp.]
MWKYLSLLTVSATLVACGGTTEDDFDVDSDGGLIRWYQPGVLSDDIFSPLTGSYLINLQSDSQGGLEYQIERINHDGISDLSGEIAVPASSFKSVKLANPGTVNEGVAASVVAGNPDGNFHTVVGDYYLVTDQSHHRFSKDLTDKGITYDALNRIEPVDKNGVVYLTTRQGGWAITSDSVVAADTVPVNDYSFSYEGPSHNTGQNTTWFAERLGKHMFRLYYVYEGNNSGSDGYIAAYLSMYEIGNPVALWHSSIDPTADVINGHDFVVNDEGVFINTWSDENGCTGTLLKYNDQGVWQRKKIGCNFSVDWIEDNNNYYGAVIGSERDPKVHVIQHRDEDDNVLAEYRLPARSDSFPGYIVKMKPLPAGRLGVIIGSSRDSTGISTPWDAEQDETYANDILILNADLSMYAHFQFHERRSIRKLHWFWSKYVTLRGSTPGYRVEDVFMSANGDVYFSGTLFQPDIEEGVTNVTQRFGVVH